MTSSLSASRALVASSRIRMRGFFAYSDNYLIDVKFGVIIDVEASRATRQAEVGAAKTMIERTEERFGLKPERLAADGAYGAAPMLNWLVEEKGIAPHIPMFDKSKRDDGTFSRGDFRYDPTGDVYHCPGGKKLETSGTIHEGNDASVSRQQARLRYMPTQSAGAAQRNHRARSRATSMSMPETLPDRSQVLRLGRLRLRGPRGAQDEFILAAIAQNLRRLASLIARPPPAHALCIASRWSCVESVRAGGSKPAGLNDRSSAVTEN
jgi:hypothetical protein